MLARSAGVFHWTPEGRRLYDFTSGVLVANLGHNPRSWMQRFTAHMGWDRPQPDRRCPAGFFSALPMTAYNAVTPVWKSRPAAAWSRRLQGRPGGRRLEQVLWAASGSEAIQKALWAALARDRARDMIVATRYGFHGKKGLAGAVTGCETDHDRDPRVRFISFPTTECADVSLRGRPFDPAPYRRELDALLQPVRPTADRAHHRAVPRRRRLVSSAGRRTCRLLQEFCRENDMVFILDEVQSNFGRTGDLFAYETYGLEPDVVVLGKGLGNGVPVAAAVGPGRPVRRPRLRRRLRHLERQPALLRGRAGDAGGVRRPRRAGPQPAGVGRASRRGWCG